MTSPHDDRDPLEGGDKAPAMSFKNQAIGTIHLIDVDDPGKTVQSRDFATGEPAYWPGNKPGEVGNPKMAAVYNGTDEQGEPLSLWAPIPSDLMAKLKAAQTELGHRIGTQGVDRIKVRLDDRVKVERGEKSVYSVKIERGPARPQQPEPDPIGDPFPSGSKPADDAPPW